MSTSVRPWDGITQEKGTKKWAAQPAHAAGRAFAAFRIDGSFQESLLL
jgi:hypothetical protein